ncbi:hypothetical protein [Agrilutibacter solisilvae]|uniref:DUF1795 domain-containing protein n=1 Tax=Agrilutibacter solisilvae TaxID=2763317 RepID=A0A974Y022_9GAMM|nr:hypothetical protein [Lysobacter solisilvae]QSX78941.1 hypothetical protein I8J32_003170 [Lysobacter solisilvae]
MFKHLIATALLLVAGAATAAEADSHYVNNTVGLQLTKPDGWHYLSAAQNLENLKRTDFGSAEFKQNLVKYTTAPLVVLAQHEEPYDGLNASFKVNLKPFGAMPRDGKAILQAILPSFRQQFANLEVVTPPTDATVAARPAGHLVINYTLRSAEGGEFPTTSEMWIVPAGDYFFMIGAGYTQGDAATRAQIQDALESIQLAAPN